MNIENVSCAADMAKLSAICIKNEYFKNIVSTSYYETRAKQKVIKIGKKENEESNKATGSYDAFQKLYKETEGIFVDRFYKWENTNFMLRQPGYNGLKTGITEAAGACLSASFSS